MAFPSSIPSYTGFTSSHTLSQDQHAAQHNQEQGDITALAQKVGTGASTPTGNTVLRGNGTGTTTYDQVHLNTDVSNVLQTSNGGTGQNNLTSLPLVSPNITGGGSWTGAPSLSAPNISDFSNATHTHDSPSHGGTLNAANALQAGSVSYANLLATLFSGQVQTKTDAAFTEYYVNLGGIKILWSNSSFSSAGGAGTFSRSMNLPANFFNTVQACFPYFTYTFGAPFYIWATANTFPISTSVINWQVQATAAGNFSDAVFVIGT